MKKFLARFLGNERWQSLTIPLIALTLSFVAISLLILVIGKNPFDTFKSLLAGSGWIPKPNYSGGKGQINDFMGFLDALTPMIFAALAVTAALRSGLFNIGVSGQMLLAGFVATITIGYSDLSSVVAWPLVLLIGLSVGGLAGGLMGWLKYQFNIHEVVSSIMLNNIFLYLISFFIKTRYLDPVSRQSIPISSQVRLQFAPITIGGIETYFPIGLPIAIGMAIVLWYLFKKTTLGLELTAVGKNMKAAEYSGINTGRMIILAMIISGALAGLAGATFYLGYYRSINPGVLTSVGFDSIAVALLGNIHPLGVILSSILLTTLTNGATYMSSVVGVRHEIASLIVGLVLLFSACGGFIKLWIERTRQPDILPYDESERPPPPEEVLGREGGIRV